MSTSTTASTPPRPELAAEHKSRSHTDPVPSSVNVPPKWFKRIIVCCDGTWQDGLLQTHAWGYTNVLKLARSINYDDDRLDTPIPQIVFYQSGVGTELGAISKVVDGAMGVSLGDKVQEAYAFIAHNYKPGDEIFLFGFSRGAYTARMVAALIGEIGVLDRKDMDSFAEILVSYQKRGTVTDETERNALTKLLEPWTSPSALGRQRADPDKDEFTIKCVGVFDTVGALGLPGGLFQTEKTQSFWGFNDKMLGPHIQSAFQALALNEPRKDFDCAKFEQTDLGRQRKQVLKQCWFSGCHSDIGGSYEEHDLSDLTLMWMASQIGDILSLDMKYLEGLPNPIAPWGEQQPHDPTKSGVMVLADTIKRQLPQANDPKTIETIHPSVLQQKSLSPDLLKDIKVHPELICALSPLEEQVKAIWKVNTENLSQNQLRAHNQLCGKSAEVVADTKSKVDKVLEKGAAVLEHAGRSKTMTSESGQPIYHENLFGKLMKEVGIKSSQP